MTIIPFGEWLPDQFDLNNPGSPNIQNVYPRTPDTYGPVAGLNSFTLSLTARCQGAQGFRDSAGNAYIFAGDASKLYEITAASSSPSNVSGINAYNATALDFWFWTQNYNTVIASQIGDPIQSFILGTSTKFADLAAGGITSLTLVAGSGYSNGTYALTVSNPGSGTGFAGTVTVSGGGLSSFAITNPGRNYPQTATISIPAGAGAGSAGSITPTIATIAPEAKFVAMVRDFCMVAYTNDATSGTRPQRVWWSALNDPTNWPTPGTATASAVQSNYVDTPGDIGPITGLVENVGPTDAVLFFQGGVFRIMYQGPPDVFSILPARGVKGCIAPGSIVNTELGVFYLGPDDFYLFDGVNVTPLGFDKIAKWFFANLDASNVLRVSAVVDPNNPIIWVAFPSNANVGGNPDTIIACNYRLQSTMGTPGRWSKVTGQTVELLFLAASLGFTLEQLDNISATLEGVPASLDSQVWQGNAESIFSAFNASHALNYFTGNNLAPTLDTKEIQFFPGKRARIRRALPIIDGGAPSIAVGTRSRQEDAVSFGSASSLNADGYCPLNSDSRYHRLRVTLPANSTFNHCMGVDIPEDSVTETGTR